MWFVGGVGGGWCSWWPGLRYQDRLLAATHSQTFFFFCSSLKRHVFTSVYVTRRLVSRLLPEARLWLIGVDVKGRCFVGSKGVKRSRLVDVVVVVFNSGMQMIRSYQYSETKKETKNNISRGQDPNPGLLVLETLISTLVSTRVFR